MCGVAGIVNIKGRPIPDLQRRLELQSSLLAHRGPDGSGLWLSPRQDVGFCHRRLAIIDLTEQARQPMRGPNGTVITYNGEIYNYIELRESLRGTWQFRSTSDTECILASYSADDVGGISTFRGMFAFGLWDENRRRFIAARDRFGIKPFYYAVVDDALYFASEIKAVLPFLPTIDTDAEALAEYLTFQYTIGERTLFKGVNQLLPGHWLSIENGAIKIARYWDVQYEIDFDHSPGYFERLARTVIDDSLKIYLRFAVSLRAYPSGGGDSSLVALFAATMCPHNRLTLY